MSFPEKLHRQELAFSPRQQMLAACFLLISCAAVYFALIFSGRAPLIAVGIGIVIVLTVVFRHPIIATALVAFAQVSPLWVAHNRKIVAFIGVSLLATFLNRMFFRSYAPRLTKHARLFLLLGAWSVVSILWSTAYDHPVFYDLLYVTLLVLLFTETIRTQSDIVLVVLALGLGAVATAFAAAYSSYSFFASGQAELVRAFSQNEQSVRFVGGWASPNTMAATIVPVIGLCYAVFRSSLSRMFRWAAAAVLIFGPLAIFLSMSRGSILALIVLALLLLFAEKKSGILLIFFSLAAVVIVSVLPLNLIGRMETLLRGKADASVSERASILRGGIAMVEDSFPFGSGAGTFKTFSADYIYFREFGIGPHNIYLEFLAELGLIGFAFFIMVLISVYLQVRTRRWQIDTTSFRQTMNVCMMSVFISMLLLGMFSSFALYSGYWMILSLLSVRRLVFNTEESGIGSVERA